MTYILAILAGLVQGLSEFLPISSTGHLIIFENLFGISQDVFGLAFDASLHLGTLLAVVIFFFRDYLRLLSFKNPLLLKLVIGTIPAVVVGLLLESQIESNFRQIPVVAAALIIFSFVMILAEKMATQKKNQDMISASGAFIIGIFQSIALIPGISRSGSTISGGLFLGLKRDEAARFAFMLSGPVIAGAGLKKFIQVLSANNPGSVNLNFFLIGMVSSFVFGYLTIKYFLKYLRTKNLYPFIIYRLILGALLLVITSLN